MHPDRDSGVLTWKNVTTNHYICGAAMSLMSVEQRNCPNEPGWSIGIIELFTLDWLMLSC